MSTRRLSPVAVTPPVNLRHTSPTTAHPFAGARTAGERRRHLTDRVIAVVLAGLVVVALIPLVSLLWMVASRGYERLSPYFLTVSMNGVYGGMDAGGIYHAILGTVEVTGLATAISVPIGIAVAVYLVEYGAASRLARLTTFLVDVMTGIPSIVAGLFAAAVFALLVSPAYRAGIIGAVALSILMIPTVIRASEEMLRLVPQDLREAAYALGVPRWRTVIFVVLRSVVAGLTTSVMLAIARVIGETAPLLVTVGVIDSINRNPFDGRMMTLPVLIYRQYSQGMAPCAATAESCIPTINYDRAWAAALVLIAIIMILNLVARLIARRLCVAGKR